MKSIRGQRTVLLWALLAAATLSGCMAHRPYPYNRPSFHASRDRAFSETISRAQLARWHRPANEQLVTATMTANSSQELAVSP